MLFASLSVYVRDGVCEFVLVCACLYTLEDVYVNSFMINCCMFVLLVWEIRV